MFTSPSASTSFNPVTMEVEDEDLFSAACYGVLTHYDSAELKSLEGTIEVDKLSRKLILTGLPSSYTPSVGDSLFIWNSAELIGKFDSVRTLTPPLSYPNTTSRQVWIVTESGEIGGDAKERLELLYAPSGSLGGTHVDCGSDWNSHTYNTIADIKNVRKYSNIHLDTLVLDVSVSE